MPFGGCGAPDAATGRRARGGRGRSRSNRRGRRCRRGLARLREGALGDDLGHLLEHDLRVPRLRQVRVGADLRAAGGVVGCAVTDEDHDRNVGRAGVALERHAQVVAVLARHLRVGEHDGRLVRLGFRERLFNGARADVLEVGVPEGDVRDLLHRRAVIDAKNDLAHVGPPRLARTVTGPRATGQTNCRESVELLAGRA